MSANEDIRKLMLAECVTLKKLSELTAQKCNKYTADGLSKKLRQNTLKYTEAKYLGDILGYDVVWVKRK